MNLSRTNLNPILPLRLISVCVILFAHVTSSGQSQDSLKLPEVIFSNYLQAVSVTASGLQSKLDKHTKRSLQHWKRLENKIACKLRRSDSAKAKMLFGQTKEQFSNLEQQLSQPQDLNTYVPALDTLKTSIKFLEKRTSLSQHAGLSDQITKSAVSLNGLENKLQQSQTVQHFLKERKELLRKQLDNVGFAKDVKKLSKQAYYYQKQINEYKDALKDHRKAEKKGLELLGKTKAFQDFMRKNSQLASMFRLPGGGSDPASAIDLTGLQTRNEISQVLEQRVGSSGLQQVQQNIQQAQSELSSLKNKLNELGGSGGDAAELPNFKPNNQRTKSFLKRLEYGTNIQSQGSTRFAPVSSDLALSVGYKLNNKSIIGTGISYKLGLGEDIRKIRLTHQGIGFRSFLDYQLKGSFYASAGFELNYRNAFHRLEELRGLNAWQQSGLVGISKIVSLKTKFFKKTKLQLLWDFLSYQEVPREQPLSFRVGYHF